MSVAQLSRGCPEGEADIMGGKEGGGVQEGREQRERSQEADESVDLFTDVL